MVNHPNMKKKSGKREHWETPPPDEIRQAREAAGLTQLEAAQLIFGTYRGWHNYEVPAKLPGGERNPEHRRMHPAIFGFFLLLTGQATVRDMKRAAAAAGKSST